MKGSISYIKNSLLLAVLLTIAGECFALTPAALRNSLAAGDKITIIDIRNKSSYNANHIYNAINIPARLIKRKRLPRFGRVVVYGTSVNIDAVLAAVLELNQKTGISAEALQGGLEAWMAAKQLSTRTSGMARENVAQITYQQLSTTLSQEVKVVLVELETSTKIVASAGYQTNLAGLLSRSPNISKTKIRFPRQNLKSRLLKFPNAALSNLKNKLAQLYVLIASDADVADKVARSMKLSGINNIAILIGGRLVIEKAGIPESKVQVLGR